MTETADHSAIRTVVERWLAASKSGDLATVASLMTDDAVFLVPGRPPFGKTEFLQASRAMAGISLDAQSTVEELVISGPIAYLRARIDLVMTPSGGTAIKKSGHTLTVFRKEPDGAWRLARDANLIA